MTQIVDTTDELTPQWFTEVLRSSETLGAHDEVVSVDATVIGTGQAGFVARAQLGYARYHAGPATLIVKLPSADASSRQMGAAMGIYESEVRFYQQIAPRLGSAIPAVYWGDVDSASCRFTLVLEDLGATSDVGDMVGGGTLAQAELAIGALPGLQAPIWDDPGLAELSWAGLARTELLFAAVEPLIESFVPDSRIGWIQRTWSWTSAQQDRLVHHYHDGLRAAGVEEFSFAQCQESYRVSSLYPFLLTIAVSVALQQTERGDQMWAQMFTNSTSIVTDTGADALLLS